MDEKNTTDVVATRMGQIMLRFRPIAPKPGSGPPVEYDSCSSSGRRRGNNNNKGGIRGRKKRATSTNVQTNNISMDVSRPVVTLSLMPEFSQLDQKINSQVVEAIPSSSNNIAQYVASSGRKTPTTTTTSNVVVESVVGFVDDRNDPWRWLSWCKEKDAITWLENEISPAFVSNGFESVMWTNPAYRRMVEKEMETSHDLVMPMVEISKSPRVSTEQLTGNAFTCRVKVNYMSQRERGSFAALCDMWRLLDGLFAWRIDVDAALSLGR